MYFKPFLGSKTYQSVFILKTKEQIYSVLVLLNFNACKATGPSTSGDKYFV